MKVNIQELLADCGLEEQVYPGKRLVKKLPQPGEFKSHCMVYDWHDPENIRIEIKAGLSGRTMENKDLSKYPVCFQAPSFIDIEVNDNDDVEDDEDEEEGKGNSGGGGKKPKKKLEELGTSMKEFLNVAEGKIAEAGEIVQMVVMGKEIAKEAYGAVLDTLKAQVQNAKIAATELLAQAGDFVTKYTPPAFMEPTGDETAVYNYDREKNADIGFTPRMNL